LDCALHTDEEAKKAESSEEGRAFVIVHRSFVICHCPEIIQWSLGIDRLLRQALVNYK
jgi:hypothetical protein